MRNALVIHLPLLRSHPGIHRPGWNLFHVKVPMLFLQGTKDELATWDLIESVCESLPRAKLVRIEGADHSFKAGKQNVIQVLADITNDWIEKIN